MIYSSLYQYILNFVLLQQIFSHREESRREAELLSFYFHSHIQVISRGKGKSAVAAAAYRAGETITNEYDGYKFP